jgi:2-methylcitrate dehydratase PrpD
VLADHVLAFPTGGLPPSTSRRATLLVLDTLGAAIAAVDADGVVQLREVVRRAGGTPEAGVFATGERTTAAQAALVNATMARALEIDDVHETGLTHATATMVPVALAVAARQPELGLRVADGDRAGSRCGMRDCCRARDLGARSSSATSGGFRYMSTAPTVGTCFVSP